MQLSPCGRKNMLNVKISKFSWKTSVHNFNFWQYELVSFCSILQSKSELGEKLILYKFYFVSICLASFMGHSLVI